MKGVLFLHSEGKRSDELWHIFFFLSERGLGSFSTNTILPRIPRSIFVFLFVSFARLVQVKQLLWVSVVMLVENYIRCARGVRTHGRYNKQPSSFPSNPSLLRRARQKPKCDQTAICGSPFPCFQSHPRYQNVSSHPHPSHLNRDPSPQNPHDILGPDVLALHVHGTDPPVPTPVDFHSRRLRGFRFEASGAVDHVPGARGALVQRRDGFGEVLWGEEGCGGRGGGSVVCDCGGEEG